YTKIITHRFPLKDIQEAFNLASKDRSQFIKIMLKI
ncbi:alcohol dehydrogenase, partial [Candidatus Aerophobetes bacterium]